MLLHATARKLNSSYDKIDQCTINLERYLRTLASSDSVSACILTNKATSSSYRGSPSWGTSGANKTKRASEGTELIYVADTCEIVVKNQAGSCLWETRTRIPAQEGS